MILEGLRNFGGGGLNHPNPPSVRHWGHPSEKFSILTQNIWREIAISSYYKHSSYIFHILLTVHPNIMIVFCTNLTHKLFILIHLLYSSMCFEHYHVQLKEGICINTASDVVTLLSDCSDRRLRQD